MRDIIFFSIGFIVVAVGIFWPRVLKAKRRAQYKDDVHVFLDLETLGVTPGSAVMVIAAHAVNSLGEWVDSMQVRVSRVSAEQYGTADEGTLKWWSEQSERAQREAFMEGPRVQLPLALNHLDAFFGRLPTADVQVWGNSPTLDCQLLRDAYAATGKTVPWAYYQERDCRTLAHLAEFKDLIKFGGTPHVALDDAIHQARYTIATLRSLLRY